MLVILVFGILASLSFRKKLKEKGYSENRAWAFPLLSASFIYCFAWFVIYLSRFWIEDFNSGIARTYPLVVGFLALLVHGLLISRLWKQIKNLPDLSKGEDIDSNLKT